MKIIKQIRHPVLSWQDMPNHKICQLVHCKHFENLNTLVIRHGNILISLSHPNTYWTIDSSIDIKVVELHPGTQIEI
jgi:hypothetical protein